MTTPVYIEIAVPTPLRQGFTYAMAAVSAELDFGDPERDAERGEGTPQPGTPQPGTRFYIQFGRQKLVGIMLGTTSSLGGRSWWGSCSVLCRHRTCRATKSAR